MIKRCDNLIKNLNRHPLPWWEGYMLKVNHRENQIREEKTFSSSYGSESLILYLCHFAPFVVEEKKA